MNDSPASPPAADDALAVRARLPADFAWLEAELPRASWDSAALHATARHWLQMHDGFRRAHAQFERIGAAWRERRIDEHQFQRAMMPMLQDYLSHLHGHHGIESGHYFPALARLEPRIAAGFELLDRDHQVIEKSLADIVTAANAYNLAFAGGGSEAARTTGARFLDEMDAATAPLARHLLDEEDIVVPLLTLRGDPLG